MGPSGVATGDRRLTPVPVTYVSDKSPSLSTRSLVLQAVNFLTRPRFWRQIETNVNYCGQISNNLQSTLSRLRTTVWTIKTCHFILGHNFRISWQILTLLVAVETGMNALQCAYLLKSVGDTSKVVKVYLSLNKLLWVLKIKLLFWWN